MHRCLLRPRAILLSAFWALGCSTNEPTGAAKADARAPDAALPKEAGAQAVPEWETVLGKEQKAWFLTTWGTTASDRYVGGGRPTTGAIYHFDGDRWEADPLPENTRLVNWLHGFAADDIFAVTNEGGALHYDGESWTALATPTTEDLWGVWGASPDKLWAVGGSGETDAKATVLFYNGKTWTDVDTSIARPGVHAYFKVWGSSANNVYVVGQNGVMQHYDGKTWTELNIGASDDLIGIWGTGPSNIVAVGGRSSAIVSHFNGKNWNTQTLFSTPGANGVWLHKSGVAHLALTQGYLATLSLPELELTLEPSDDFLDFHALYGTTDGMLTAAALNAEASVTEQYAGLVTERKLTKNE